MENIFHAADEDDYHVVEEALRLELHKNMSDVDAQGNTLLMRAVKQNSIRCVELLLKIGVDSTCADFSGWRPLNRAVASGHTTLVRLLLAHGADPSFHDYDKCIDMPLHIAATEGHSDVIRLLVENGKISVDTVDKQGNTALVRASKKNNVDCMRVLLELCAATVPSATHSAAVANHVEALHMLLESGANVNGLDPTDQTTTPLLNALNQSSAIEVVRLLLEKGADPNARDAAGQLPLIIASKFRRLDVCTLLLEYGADIEGTSSSQSGDTALSKAVIGSKDDGDLALPLLFLKRGAIVCDVAVVVATDGSIELLDILLKNGGNANAKAYDSSALFEAVHTGRTEIVQLLLEHGADPTCPCGHETPLMIAVQENHLQVALLLLHYGADIEARDEEEWSPLWWAVASGSMECVKLLLELGAVTSVSNKGGCSLLSGIVDDTPIEQRDDCVHDVLYPCWNGDHGYSL